MTPEEKLNNLLSGMTVRINIKKPLNIIYFFKEDEFYFYLILNSNVLYISRKNLWFVFDHLYGMNTQQVRKLMKDYVEQHLKLTIQTNNIFASDYINVQDLKRLY